MQNKTLAIWLLIPFGILYFNYGYAQLLNRDAKWVTGFQRKPAYEHPEWSYYTHSIKKDSVINGIEYSIFENWAGVYGIRESQKMVYCRELERRGYDSSPDTTERIMYNFNLNLADTFKLYNNFADPVVWSVTKTDSVIINNKAKKRIWLEEVTIVSEKRSTYCIEDVGSSYGLFWNIAITNMNYTAELNCFMISDQPVYGRCTTTVGTGSTKRADNPVVFVNNSSQVKIELPDYECKLKIYSITGQHIFNGKFLCNKYADVFFPGPGIYIFEITTKNNRYSNKLFVN